MGNLSDIALATRVAMFHDRKAFDQLVLSHQAAVRKFFLAQTLGDKALSDDLAQDTFLKAYTHIGQFRATSRFSTWLFRIAYNVFYDHLRRTHPADDISHSAQAMDRKSPVAGGLQMDLSRALAQLSDQERTCILLQLVEGYSLEEIATISAMPLGTVKSHLSRGKHKLTTYLKANGYER